MQISEIYFCFKRRSFNQKIGDFRRFCINANSSICKEMQQLWLKINPEKKETKLTYANQ